MHSVQLYKRAKRVTIERVHIEHTTKKKGLAAPSDFGVSGTAVLIDRCTVKGDGLFYMSTGSGVSGPNVVLNCTFRGNGAIQPHQRWATGLLVDNCHTPEGNIEFMNRGYMGSGHGWTIGWAVAWNCSAKSFLIQQPPGTTNWSIGCIGPQWIKSMPGGDKSVLMPQGVIESMDTPVEPKSLYLTQLRERLGEAAVRAIGY